MPTSTLAVWVMILGLSLSAIVISAAAGKPEVHMAMTGLVSLVIAVLAIRQDRSLRAAGASRSAIAASTARYMGLIWVWGALALFMTYFFILPEWREWPQFFFAFLFVSVISIFFAAALEKDAQKGTDDETMLKLGDGLTWLQMIGMVATAIGLMIDSDKSLLDTSRRDWAANNIFFFGGLSLAAISANAILANRTAKK